MATALIRETKWTVSTKDMGAFFAHSDVTNYKHTSDNGFLALSYGETCNNMHTNGFDPVGFSHAPWRANNSNWAFGFYDNSTDEYYWVHVSDTLYTQWSKEMEKLINL